MDTFTLTNLLAYSGQVAVLVVAAALVLALLRVQAPMIRYTCWRAVLVTALALPFVQGSQPTPIEAVPSAPSRVATFQEAAATDAPLTVTTDIEWSTVVWMLLAAGALGRGLWLVVGFVRLRRRRHSGRPATDREFDDMQRALGTRADIRYADEVTQPVMFGARRPVVLLPAALQLEAADIREAVVAHELWHVRRWDWPLVVGEEIIRAVLWFHPAIWWVLGEIRASREQVVDALTVAFTGRRTAYVRALLAFADATPLAPVAAFGWRRQLFRRILHVSREDAMSTTRFMSSVLVLALVVVAGSWYAVRAFPLTHAASLLSQSQEIGPVEQRAKSAAAGNPIPRRLEAVQPVFPDRPEARDVRLELLVRATVDESGVVAETRVVRLLLRAREATTTVTGPDGRLMTVFHPGITVTIDGDDMMSKLDRMFEEATFRAVPGEPAQSLAEFRPAVEESIGSALSAIRQWRYEPPVDRPIAFDVAVTFADGTVAASPAYYSASEVRGAAQLSELRRVLELERARTGAAESPLAAGALRVGGNIRTPTKTRDAKPVYPADAKEARVQGVVILEARIEGDGRVSQARVLRSIPMLDQAALDAVGQWEFTPTLLNGVPTPVVLTLTMQFSLQ